MILLCICKPQRSQTLHLNTANPKNQTVPNTPLKIRLHYEILTQTDADESKTQIMFHYTNITQICNQMNTKIIITQNQYIDEHKLEYKS